MNAGRRDARQTIRIGNCGRRACAPLMAANITVVKK